MMPGKNTRSWFNQSGMDRIEPKPSWRKLPSFPMLNRKCRKSIESKRCWHGWTQANIAVAEIAGAGSDRIGSWSFPVPSAVALARKSKKNQDGYKNREYAFFNLGTSSNYLVMWIFQKIYPKNYSKQYPQVKFRSTFLEKRRRMRLRKLKPWGVLYLEIGDDKGYWNKLEIYHGEYSEAEFSHGICPECVQRLYPDIHKEIVPVAWSE